MNNWIFRTLVPFFCGSVVVMNLSGLVDINPNYEYEWWKVAAALVLFIILPLTANDK